MKFECRVATNEERAFTARKLIEHSEKSLGRKIPTEEFGLLVYDNGKLIGSIVGKIFFNWLHIDLIWVDDEHRLKGVGKELMRQAEEKAKELQLTGIEVWTQSWQAPEFYQKLSYQEFAAIDDFTPNQKRYAFRWYAQENPTA